MGSQPVSERQDPGLDLFQNSLISAGVLAIGIFNIPVFDIGEGSENAIPRGAGQVDDEVGVIESFAGDGLGGDAVESIAIGEESLLREFRNAAESVKPRAGGIENI